MAVQGSVRHRTKPCAWMAPLEPSSSGSGQETEFAGSCVRKRTDPARRAA